MTGLSFRPARRQDCRTIARLFQISSQGVADYVWSRRDCPGLSLLEIGAHRYARDDAAYSYTNCLLALREGRTVGLLHSFGVPEAGDAALDGSAKSDPVLRPYGELALPGSLHVASLAVFPEHRGRGIGARLLEAAHRKASLEGYPSVSLVCFEGNRDALRFLRREGYSPVARRAVVPHPLIGHGGDAVMMLRSVESLDLPGDDDGRVVRFSNAAA